MDHEQGFVVGVSSRGRPVETASDYCFVVDYGELVVVIFEMGLSAWVLMDPHAAQAIC